MGKLEGMRPLERLGINGRIILRWILRKWVGGSCKCGNEPLGSIKYRKFFD